MKSIVFTLFFSLLFSFNTNAQTSIDNSIITEKYTAKNKGKFYVYYGGNRGYYTNSSLKIRGEGYDFTLHDLKAHDRPSEGSGDYFNPLTLTAPQTNYRIGYYIHNKYNISIGLDHMKYVMTQNQTAKISGTYPSIYNGNQVNNGLVDLSDGKFLQFEHTDGLNYINLEVARVDDLSKYIGIKNTDIVQINLINGLGAGILFPKTDATLFQKTRSDQYSISGYGMHLKAGLNLTILKHFFVQSSLSGGYINMGHIRVSKDSSDVGSQDFFFMQRDLVFGTIWKFF